MSFINRWLSSSRVRGAARKVAKDPTSRSYAELAQEYAVLGDLEEVLRATAEGLRLFPGDSELKRLESRARSLKLEGRMREVQAELKSAPRPALWKELCEILLESGRVARAEEIAAEWYQATREGEAQFYRAGASRSNSSPPRKRACPAIRARCACNSSSHRASERGAKRAARSRACSSTSREIRRSKRASARSRD